MKVIIDGVERTQFVVRIDDLGDTMRITKSDGHDVYEGPMILEVREAIAHRNKKWRKGYFYAYIMYGDTLVIDGMVMKDDEPKNW